jgi:hypothetical protein
MAFQKQKIAEKDKEVEKRLSAVEAAHAIRERIAQAHGAFPGINSLIRETREGTTS